MARVTKDTMIGDLLQIDQTVAPEAAMVHGLDPDDLVVEINTFIDHDLG